MVLVWTSQQHRHYSSNRRYDTVVVPVWCRYAAGNNTGTIEQQPALLLTVLHWLIPSAPSDFTGTSTIAGNRHYRGTAL